MREHVHLGLLKQCLTRIIFENRTIDRKSVRGAALASVHAP